MSEVVYVAQFITEEISRRNGIEWRSPAGYHKKVNVIRALGTQFDRVQVVSPAILNRGLISHEPPRTVDADVEANVSTPRSINVARSSVANHLLLSIFTFVSVWRHCMREEVDAIVFYNFHLETAIPAIFGGALTGTPVIVEYEDGLFVSDSRWIRFAARILRLTVGRCIDGAVCVTSHLAEIAPTENVVVVRGFPSVGFPEELPEPADRGERISVMFAGHFDDVRGVHTFLDVVEGWDGPTIDFWISGHGSDDQISRVERRVKAVPDERLRFFGTLPWEEYKQRLVDADVLVNCQDPKHPISRYTFPSKLLDFMSSCSVVISTDMSDLREGLGTALVVDGTSADELNATIAEVVSNITEYSQKAERASKWVDIHCRHDTVGRMYAEVIEESHR